MITERAIEIDEARSDFDKLMQNNMHSETFGNFKMLDNETNEFIGLVKLELEIKMTKV